MDWLQDEFQKGGKVVLASQMCQENSDVTTRMKRE